MAKSDFKLKLKGITAVFIDWANVYGWKKSLKGVVDPKLLWKYLKSYPEIKEISFYFGTDKHPMSGEFLKQARKIGYRVTTKPVKFLPVVENGVLVWNCGLYVWPFGERNLGDKKRDF